MRAAEHSRSSAPPGAFPVAALPLVPASPRAGASPSLPLAQSLPLCPESPPSYTSASISSLGFRSPLDLHSPQGPIFLCLRAPTFGGAHLCALVPHLWGPHISGLPCLRVPLCSLPPGSAASSLLPLFCVLAAPAPLPGPPTSPGLGSPPPPQGAQGSLPALLAFLLTASWHPLQWSVLSLWGAGLAAGHSCWRWDQTQRLFLSEVLSAGLLRGGGGPRGLLRDCPARRTEANLGPFLQGSSQHPSTQQGVRAPGFAAQ